MTNAELKVWGARIWAPNTWEIEESPNGDRQRRVVVAAPTVAAALRAYAAHGINISRSQFNQRGCETGNEREISVALSEPGSVFYANSDRWNPTYLPAPKEES